MTDACDALKNKDADILRDNIFIRYFTDLYDIKVLHDISNDPDNFETRVIKKGLFKKEVKKVNLLEEAYFKKLNEFIQNDLHENSDMPISFSILWQFCQFIRWAEKVAFWQNDLANRVIVDSGIKDGVINDNPRHIVFQGHDISTNIKLELSRIRFNKVDSILSLDPPPDKSDVINMEVSRTFGKKMSSKYVIVDGIVNYQDISDIYLMNTVNKIVKDAIIHTFKLIIFEVETMQSFTDFNTDLDKTVNEFFTSHLS